MSKLFLQSMVIKPSRVNWRRAFGEIESGMVFINDFTHTDPRAPFGGFKASGYGRELGAPSALELTNPKLIWQAA
jgi:succinate-semialdehyde dehydrogenase/glutarate-semialdehyde dehydrogenase